MQTSLFQFCITKLHVNASNQIITFTWLFPVIELLWSCKHAHWHVPVENLQLKDLCEFELMWCEVRVTVELKSATNRIKQNFRAQNHLNIFGPKCHFTQNWLNSSVMLSSSGLFFSTGRQHAAGSGKKCSTGVSITASYVTGATHTHTHRVVHSSVYRLPLPQSYADVFQLLPGRIKHSPHLIKQPISSYSMNNNSGKKHWMLITNSFSYSFLCSFKCIYVLFTFHKEYVLNYLRKMVKIHKNNILCPISCSKDVWTYHILKRVKFNLINAGI